MWVWLSWGPRLNRKTVLRVIGASGCALFILSMLLPFLQAQWIGMKIPEAAIGPEDLWSFKKTYIHGYMGDHSVIRVEEYWFADYWNRGGELSHELGSWVGPFLIFMFEAQVFTVLFAALTILKVKPYLFLSSAILNGFTTFCMGFVTYAMSRWYEKTLQAGFWITFCSAALFVVAFLASWRQHRRTQGAKATETPPHPNQ